MFNFEELLSIPNILTIQLSSIKTDLQKKNFMLREASKKGIFITFRGETPPPPLYFLDAIPFIYLFIQHF